MKVSGINRTAAVLLIHLLVPAMGGWQLAGQEPLDGDTLDSPAGTALVTGWADEAVDLGYISAPSVLVLMFVSGLVSEWNAGYFGIPASVMILAAPPLICLGGRSVDLPFSECRQRAKLGWVLYALAIIPTSMALYSYTTDWGASIPLMITSGVLGSASIAAMSSYAYSRAQLARVQSHAGGSSWHLGIVPLRGGAMAMLSLRF
jgi:hypothetical protein